MSESPGIEDIKAFIQNNLANQKKKTVGINEISAQLKLTKRDVVERLRQYLQDTLEEHPEGVTITNLTSLMKINRNWIAKQLDILFLAGRVEKKSIGPAKIYKISRDGLNKWEKYYLALLENSSDLIAVISFKENPDGVVTFVSQSIERMLGYLPKEAEGSPFRTIVHPDDLPSLEVGRDYLAGKTSDNIIYLRCRTKSGDWKNLEITITSLIDDPNVEGVIANCKDITETLTLQQQIQFRSIFEKFLLSLSNTFIDYPIQDFDKILTNSIEMLGKFFTQNRLKDYAYPPDSVMLYLISPDITRVIRSHSWTREDLHLIGNLSNDWSTDELAWWGEKMKEEDVFYAEDLDKLSGKALEEIEKLTSNKINSLIALPFIDKTKNLIGFVIFEFLQLNVHWSDDSLEMLNTIRTMLQSALRGIKRYLKQDLFSYFAEKLHS
ncbi:MAG: PAS domain S-box protein [Promethearchaeota archaeon]